MKKKLLLLPLFILSTALLQGQISITAQMGWSGSGANVVGSDQIVLPAIENQNIPNGTAFNVDFGSGALATFTIAGEWGDPDVRQWGDSLEAGKVAGDLVITLTGLTNVSALTYEGFAATSVDAPLMVTAVAPSGASVTVNDNGSFVNTSNAGAWTVGQTLKLVQESGVADTGQYNLRAFGVTGTVVPEPSTYAVFLGLAGLGLALVRRRRKA